MFLEFPRGYLWQPFPLNPSHPLILSLFLCLLSPLSLPPLFLLQLKKYFLKPDLRKEALNHQRPLLSQPPIQPPKVCLSMCACIPSNVHEKRLCTLCKFAHVNTCMLFCKVCVCVCLNGSQQGARGASQGKWVFVKRKAQIGTPNIPQGERTGLY